jgi:sugar lactone lactonase YvrE
LVKNSRCSIIDVVRVFSRISKRTLATIKLPGTTFLNDLTSDAAGNVYVSDSGLTPEFKPNGTDAIYKIDAKNKVSLVAKGATLALPNGLFSSTDGTVVVAPFGSKDLYSIAVDGTQSTIATLPGGSLDGVELFEGGYYVSSWETSSVYKIKDGAISVVIDKLSSPADIGIDAKRGQLLVPLLNENRLVFQPL